MSCYRLTDNLIDPDGKKEEEFFTRKKRVFFILPSGGKIKTNYHKRGIYFIMTKLPSKI